MGDTQRDGTVMGEGQQTRSPLLTGVAYPAAQDGSADCDTDGGAAGRPLRWCVAVVTTDGRLIWNYAGSKWAVMDSRILR